MSKMVPTIAISLNSQAARGNSIENWTTQAWLATTLWSWFQAGKGSTPTNPELLFESTTAPRFDPARREIGGVCLVSLIVDAQGNPQQVAVVHPMGQGVDEPAIAAVKQYRFKLATRLGVPVAVEVTIKISFMDFETQISIVKDPTAQP